MADNFLEYDSWFEKKYKDNLRGRYTTMKIALGLLYQRPIHNIVETGCVRNYNDWGGGNSTYIFGDFISRYGGSLTTIDISQQNMDICKDITREFLSINYIVEDSIVALPKLTEPIDLLYLDSFDVPEDGSDASAGQAHNLKEFMAAEHLLHHYSVVLIDDNDMENGGKTRLTKPYLHQRGWRVVFNGAQSIWIR